ncbi:MAG: chemotaxis protein CheW [Deltaproteobacteria bacterium]|nr:chemotaxis protein CheW [Deltaproteobacteria bacterium]
MKDTSGLPAPVAETDSPAPARADTTFVNLCLFRVGGDEMVLDIMRIREILRPMPLTPLPRAPVGVRGLINVRGTVMPLVDLRVRFGLPPDDTGPRRRILVVLDRHRLQGLLVDSVAEVARVGRETLTSGDGILSGDAAEVFSGVLQYRGRMVLLLNLARLLARDAPVALPALPQPGGGA